MMEIVLDYNAREGQLHAVISREPGTPDKRIPLHVTHFTPCARFPILATDPSGHIPESVLDELMLENTRKENVRWHEYFKCRRQDQRDNAGIIVRNDFTFKQRALERQGKKVQRYAGT